MIGNDLLSPLTRGVLAADPTAYSRLVAPSGTPATARKLLAGVVPDQLLAVPMTDPSAARAVLAGLWLWHDALDESHTISQSLSTPDGSYWHAIMHRREGDFANAKYWYARCRHHAVLEQIPALVRATPGTTADEVLHRLIDRGAWDPDAFIDVVEAAHQDRSDPLYAAAVRLQQVEWHALFNYCVGGAAGRR